MKNKYAFVKPCKRIDIHVHLGKENNEMHCFTPEERMALDAMLGIEHSVILPFPVGDIHANGDGIFGTEEAMETAKRYPEHFSFFANVVPDGTDETLKQLTYYKEQGACGVGEFGTLYRFDDERVDHLLSCCAKLDLPFIFHISPEGTYPYGVIDLPGLPLLEQSLQKHPDVIFIGHSQPFWYELGTYDEHMPAGALNGFPFDKVHKEGRVVELMRKYPNLYADLSATSGSNAILRDQDYGLQFLNEFQDRILFGSDLLNTDYIYPIGQMLDYYLLAQKISEEAYEKICNLNARKLLNR